MLNKHGIAFGMRSSGFGLVFLCLAGCDTPSPGFRGIEPVRVSVDGSVFDVRVNDSKAEAIRLNSEYAPRLSGIAPKAVFAIEQVSGCKVTKLGGDQALIKAKLSCGGTPKTQHPAPPRLHYECEIDDVYVRASLGTQITEMTCDPVDF